MLKNLAAGLILTALLTAPSLAQDKKPEGKPAQPAAAKPSEAPAAQPSEEAGTDPMAMMMELATPGAEHELMKPFEGKWKARMKAWFAPGEPTESQGTMNNTIVMGGRFMRHEFKGEMMGMPFEGLGYWGYDKAQKQWIGSWMDSWGTGMMVSSKGTYDPASRTWTSQAVYFNPETGKEETQREVVRVLDSDTHTMEMFMVGPDGKEMKVLEITYTRAGKDSAPGQQKKDEKKPEKPAGRR